MLFRGLKLMDLREGSGGFRILKNLPDMAVFGLTSFNPQPEWPDF